MNNFLIADPAKCIGCRTCEIACVVAHSDENIFLSECKIDFNPKLTVVKTAQVSVPIQCRHCEDAPCAKVCPYNAISIVDGAITIDDGKCIGCKTCIMACPIGAIGLSEKTTKQYLDNLGDNKFIFKEKMIANKCDLCVGREGGPACSEVCPTQAFKFITESDLKNEVKNKRKQNAINVLNSINQ